MTFLHEILDTNQLDKDVAAGYISEKSDGGKLQLYNYTRFAELIKDSTVKPLIWLLYDGNSEKLTELIWKWVEPKFTSPFKKEDA